MTQSITVETTRLTEAINVTARLNALVGDVTDGIVLFHLPHTTASLLLCEDDDELRADLEQVAQRWLAECRPFAHIRNNNPNSEAHILSAFGGASLTLGVSDGKLELGTYQNILLLEMDGPKRREIWCKVIGD